MGNQFVNLPVPTGNGNGTPVDVSTFGALKTIVVGGNATATITVEINNAAVNTAGSWAPIYSCQNTGQLSLRVAARWMRVSVSGYNPYKGGTPQVDIGGTDDGSQFASLTVPTGNGVAVDVNTSALGNFKTVQVGGTFRGTLIVEVSEDGTQWAQPFSFQTPGQQSAVIAAEFMRVRRVGVPIVSPGQPIVNIGATDDFQGDDGVAISAGSQSVATGTVKFADSNGLSFGMSASSQVTASMDAFRSVMAGTATATGASLSFANGSGVTFGLTGQTITASVLSAAVRALSAGTTLATGSTISFANGSNVSFGVNGNTITASVPNDIRNLSAGTTNATGPGVSFSDGSGVTWGITGNTITASVGIGLAASAGTQLAATGTLSFANSNGLSFGLSNSSILTGTFAALKTISAGTTNATGQGVSFSNGSGVSFGLTGNTITASVAAVSAISGFAAGSQTATSGTVAFGNGSGVTFGMAGSSLVTASIAAISAISAISAGTQQATNGTVAFVNSNGHTFGMSNSSQITISSGITAPDFVNFPAGSGPSGLANVMALTNITGRPFFIPFYLPYYLTFERLNWVADLTAASSVSMSVSAGIYTIVNSTSAALLGGFSNVYNCTNTGSVTGVRVYRATNPNAAITALTPGQYVLGMQFHSIGGTTGMNMTLRGAATGGPAGYVNDGIDQEITATGQVSSIGAQFFGQYSVVSASLPNSIAGNADLFKGASATSQVPLGVWFRMERTA